MYDQEIEQYKTTTRAHPLLKPRQIYGIEYFLRLFCLLFTCRNYYAVKMPLILENTREITKSEKVLIMKTCADFCKYYDANFGAEKVKMQVK